MLATDETTYQQSQRVTDAMRATYDNVLYVVHDSDLVGSFICNITNIRGTVEMSYSTNG